MMKVPRESSHNTSEPPVLVFCTHYAPINVLLHLPPYWQKVGIWPHFDKLAPDQGFDRYLQTMGRKCSPKGAFDPSICPRRGNWFHTGQIPTLSPLGGTWGNTLIGVLYLAKHTAEHTALIYNVTCNVCNREFKLAALRGLWSYLCGNMCSYIYSPTLIIRTSSQAKSTGKSTNIGYDIKLILYAHTQ